ncbi:MAG: copper chaperone PCu(A)C [Alphaproteobacteria bacterium]|nr:copper chaperone PCu(A)C [Alphaproteobacteria bacterium]
MRALAFEIAASLLVWVGSASAADIRIREPWIRALPGNLPAAGYFELINAGKSAVTLTGAESPLCGMLMLHRSTTQDGMGRMQDVGEVTVPAGGRIAFAPGGFHLMCMDPKPALKPGGKAQVALRFSDGSVVAAAFDIRNAMGK